MIRTCLALCLTLLIPAAAAAQDEAPDRTEEFLSSLSGCDEGLLGTYHYGLILQGAKNIGTGTFVVDRAPEGSGAIYRVTATLAMKMGPFEKLEEGVDLLDERFALVKGTSVERDLEEGKRTRTETVTERDGDSWHYTCVRTTDPEGEAKTESLSLDFTNPAPIYTDMSCMMLLVRRLDRSNPGTYRLNRIKWPKPGEDESEPKLVDLVATTPAGTEAIELRGEQVTVFTARVQTGKETVRFHLSDAGEILALGPEGAPILFLAAPDAESAKLDAGTTDLPRGKGAETPLDAVMLFFRALGKVVPMDRLDEVTDWAAIKAELEIDNEQVREFPVKTVADLMKGSFTERAAALSEERLAAVEEALVVVEDGDTATVSLPGKDDGFRLERHDGRWFLTHFTR